MVFHVLDKVPIPEAAPHESALEKDITAFNFLVCGAKEYED